tara:strand:- start:107 stop:316 length:210 start_codon:yes stop_codon:yes gene_type:complete
MLESCKYVHEVLLFEEDTPYALIQKLQPDIIVKGGDYLPEDVVGADICPVHIFKYMDGYSTTSILEGIK